MDVEPIDWYDEVDEAICHYFCSWCFLDSFEQGESTLLERFEVELKQLLEFRP